MRKGIISFIALVVFAVLNVSAQDPFGSIQGAVKDAQGAVVQNATVTVRNVADDAVRNNATATPLRRLILTLG
jgi:hypothetical protein